MEILIAKNRQHVTGLVGIQAFDHSHSPLNDNPLCLPITSYIFLKSDFRTLFRLIEKLRRLYRVPICPMSGFLC